ncbi:hypothetical protein SAMN05414139_10382 [Burkholderia sp. D7]|nr:hypothetical protein SAMN05414139_10382 [Burkholderia sp. D7]
MISFSRFSRATSDRSRDNSIASGVTTLPPAPLSLPAAAALIQLRRVWPLRHSSFAAAAIVCPIAHAFDGKLLELGRVRLFGYLLHF